jgi:LemA protein
MQSSSFLPWVIAAVALFWAVGAYNRLVRLRSEANQAFGALDAELARQVRLVHECLPPAEEHRPPHSGGSALRGGLQGAAAQLTASLAAARSRPLDPERIAALGAAQEVLQMAWERAAREDAHDFAGPRLPENYGSELEQAVRMTHAATEHFNQAVQRYNQGIAQFPALLLARLFGFRPGRGLLTR